MTMTMQEGIWNTGVSEEELTDVLEEVSSENQLIVYNDDVNTFDHVIACLVKYCGHGFVQAEQCAYLIHYNGKCSVKGGAFDALKPICEALLDQGLSATIE
jgi:ATP-dependent Clp protease adaptor protein ClpS